ncbi:hypothetical protein VPHF94_0107 [Vibrio phage F94]
MTNNPTTTARVLHYKPRNTEYRVLHHNVKIKTSDGSWELGCMYVVRLMEDKQLYTRPYSMFDMDNWQIVK